MRPGKNRHFIPLLSWTFLCGLFFATILLGQQRLPAGDFTAQFHTFGLFQSEEVTQGRLPLWLPATYGGVRFVGDPQAAVFYPPRLLTILASLPWGFPLYALEFEAIVHIWLTGLFTYALAFSITKQPLAALFGAVTFSLGGYLTSYPILQLAILETITWLPLVLFLLREGVVRCRGHQPAAVGWLAGAGLVLAMSLTAGHPQTFLHASYVTAAYYLFLTRRARWSWRWMLGLGALILVIVVAGSAMMWLPALETWASSTRSQVGYPFVSTGLPLLNYLQALLPATLSFWSPEYIGLTSAILILFMWSGRHDWNKQQREEMLFWSAVALLAAWLALGDKGVLFQLIYRVAPGFSLFRQQERLLSIVSLSAALAASHSLAYWLGLETSARRRLMRQTAVIVGVLLLVAALVLLVTESIASAGWPLTLIRQLGVAVLGILLLTISLRPKLQACLLILLLAVDLYAATYSGIARQSGSPAGYWQHPRWLETMMADYEAAGVSRLDSGQTFFGNYGAVYGWEDVSGISPIKPAALAQFERLPQRLRWQLLNVSHVIGTPISADASLQPLGNIDARLVPDVEHAGTVYRLEAHLERAWMSYRPILVADQEQAFARLNQAEFNPAADVIFHTDVPEAASVAPLDPGSPPPVVLVDRLQSGQLQVSVETAAPGFLLLSEWFEPGWQAEIDGEPAHIYPADYALQAVWLPAGTHEVSLKFRPITVPIGIMLSLLTLIGAAVMVRQWRWAVSTRSVAPENAVRQRSVALSPRWVAWPAMAMNRQLNQRLWLGAMVLLTLFSFSLRLFRIGDQELRGDEAFSFLFASRPAGEIISSLVNEGDPHSPLHYLTLHGWMELAGDSELALRFLSLAAGLLTIPLMYQLGRQFHRRDLGFLVASLAAISPSLIWISQDVRNQYGVAVVFSLLATVILGRLVRQPNGRLYTGYVLSCTLTVYAHYYGLFALIAHGVYVILAGKVKRIRLMWLLAALVTVLLFLPWIITIVPATLSAGQLSDPSTPELTRHIMAVGSELVAGPVWSEAVARWIFVGLSLIGLAGALQMWSRKKPWVALLCLWLIGAVLGTYLVRFRRSTFNNFYIVVAAPAWWALVGIGLCNWLGRSWNWRRPAGLVWLTILLIISSVGLTRYYFYPGYSRTLGYEKIAQQLAQDVQANDLFLAHFPDPNFDYYLRQIPLPRTMQPATFSAEEQVTNENMARLADEYGRLWFVPAHGSNWDPEDSVFRWLDYHALLEQEVVHDRLTLSAYRPLAQVAAVMTPIEETLGDRLLLALAYLTVDGQPVELFDSIPLSVEPDALLEVSLVWEALSAISQDYTVFVHLLAENGQLLVQHDGTPASGTRPTSGWFPGEPLLDKHRLTLPLVLPTGKGSLVVGLYDNSNFERLTFSDGADFLLLSEISFASPSPPKE